MFNVNYFKSLGKYQNVKVKWENSPLSSQFSLCTEIGFPRGLGIPSPLVTLLYHSLTLTLSLSFQLHFLLTHSLQSANICKTLPY